jgi:hypothetical protein
MQNHRAHFGADRTRHPARDCVCTALPWRADHLERTGSHAYNNSAAEAIAAIHAGLLRTTAASDIFFL